MKHVLKKNRQNKYFKKLISYSYHFMSVKVALEVEIDFAVVISSLTTFRSFFSIERENNTLVFQIFVSHSDRFHKICIFRKRMYKKNSNKFVR